MSRVRENMPLAVGLVTSTLVHVAVLMPLLVMVMTARSERPMLAMDLAPDDFRELEEPEEEPEVELGIEASDASTMTWIGYDEYEEHIAELARNDQAAFTESPGELPVPAETAPPPAPSEQPAPEPEPTPAPEPTEPVPAGPSLITELLTRLAAAAEQAPLLARDTPEVTPEPPTEQKPESKPAEETPAVEPAPEPVPTEEPAVPTPAGDPGDVADKDSPPTSIETSIRELKTGKPLAAEGLEIKTRRPDFTTLQRLTQSPRNPLAELEFGADGRVKSVNMIEGTGSNVDEALISSLYRWRANGKQIDALSGKETITIRIRIFL